MSKVAVKGNDSGTGVFTIAAPNSNSDRTLNLPDEAGTVLTNVSDIEAQVKTATNATGSAPIYACRAWVNFDGDNTVIRESANVSSITDQGTGNYRVNLINSMPDSNYCAIANSSPHSGIAKNYSTGTDDLSTSSFDVRREDSTGSGHDTTENFAMVIR